MGSLSFNFKQVLNYIQSILSDLTANLGVQASSMHNFDITAAEYRDFKFILGADREKVLNAGFTGINTRAGDLMSVSSKYASAETISLADRIHIDLHSDQILEIRGSGCEVFD